MLGCLTMGFKSAGGEEEADRGQAGLEMRWALVLLQPTQATRRHEAAGVALLCSMQRLKPTAVASGETGDDFYVGNARRRRRRAEPDA